MPKPEVFGDEHIAQDYKQLPARSASRQCRRAEEARYGGLESLPNDRYQPLDGALSTSHRNATRGCPLKHPFLSYLCKFRNTCEVFHIYSRLFKRGLAFFPLHK